MGWRHAFWHDLRGRSSRRRHNLFTGSQFNAFKEQYYFCALYNCSDGDGPEAGMIAFKGMLYGTAYGGGNYGGGVAFSLIRKPARRRCCMPLAAKEMDQDHKLFC